MIATLKTDIQLPDTIEPSEYTVLTTETAEVIDNIVRGYEGNILNYNFTKNG